MTRATNIAGFLLSASILALPRAALADAPDGAPADTIIVTALRTPVEADRVASSVTVLDATDLALAQPLALTDVLVRTPGMSLARNGGYGQVSSLRIRGADPAETVMVIDGMRMADAAATNGGFDFAQLFTDDIARVEILRGPQSILWGSDAMGGVINVTTVAPTKPLEADFSVEGGTHQTVDAHAGLGGTSALVDWRLSGSTFTTQGIPTLVGGTQPNPYSRQAASGTLTFHLSTTISLDVRGYWDSGRNSFSDTYSLPTGIYSGDYGLTKQWSVYAGLNIALLDGKFKNRFSVQQDQTDGEDLTPINALYGSPALTFVGHGKTRRYEYQGTLTPLQGIDLVFGAEREEQHMRTGSPYDAVQPYELFPEAASTDSVYGEARVTPVAGLTLNGGVRYDHQSQFGGNTVFSAGAVYTPDAGTTVLRATYDEGYKAPSLYQLYSDYGNATLAPEHARGWEVGATRALFGKAVQLGAAWWERHTTNLIDFAYCPYPITPTAPPACLINGFGYYANVDKAQGRGLELTGQARVAHLFADGNYAIVVNEDRTPGSATYGNQLPRVPRHMINADLGYDLPFGVTTMVALRHAGASFNDNSYTQLLAGYTLFDWRAEWKVRDALTLFGRVENIGNRQYQTAYGYNSLGRTVYFGIRGHF
jgi:vitamin B12 transporter